ncbi:hypothetical protein FXO37_36842 [Capsicum annuum]|nr:hypothetical protein FXO37_36842 [Capsicum annuum]
MLSNPSRRNIGTDSSRIRSNESRDVDQHQEESWLRYRKGEANEGRKSATMIIVVGERVVAGGRVIVAEISMGKKEKWPDGIIEDALVQVGSLIFPVDFIILDFDADPEVPFVLGRPFLATGRSLIDVAAGQMTMRAHD